MNTSDAIADSVRVLYFKMCNASSDRANFHLILHLKGCFYRAICGYQPSLSDELENEVVDLATLKQMKKLKRNQNQNA